jgi:hypothetical protein
MGNSVKRTDILHFAPSVEEDQQNLFSYPIRLAFASGQKIYILLLINTKQGWKLIPDRAVISPGNSISDFKYFPKQERLVSCSIDLIKVWQLDFAGDRDKSIGSLKTNNTIVLQRCESGKAVTLTRGGTGKTEDELTVDYWNMEKLIYTYSSENYQVAFGSFANLHLLGAHILLQTSQNLILLSQYENELHNYKHPQRIKGVLSTGSSNDVPYFLLKSEGKEALPSLNPGALQPPFSDGSGESLDLFSLRKSKRKYSFYHESSLDSQLFSDIFCFRDLIYSYHAMEKSLMIWRISLNPYELINVRTVALKEPKEGNHFPTSGEPLLFQGKNAVLISPELLLVSYSRSRVHMVKFSSLRIQAKFYCLLNLITGESQFLTLDRHSFIFDGLTNFELPTLLQPSKKDKKELLTLLTRIPKAEIPLPPFLIKLTLEFLSREYRRKVTAALEPPGYELKLPKDLILSVLEFF